MEDNPSGLQHAASNTAPQHAREQAGKGVPGEVHPLRVAELVAHEAEPALPAQGQRGQADGLVQGHAALHALRLGGAGQHVGVHVVLHQAPGCDPVQLSAGRP